MWDQLQVCLKDFLQAIKTWSWWPKGDEEAGFKQEKDEDLMVQLGQLTWKQRIMVFWLVFSQLVYNALFACAAIAAVLVKTSQMSFLDRRAWDEWTIPEGIALASFINALSGLGLDPNLVGLVKVLRERYSNRKDLNDSELVTSWQCSVLDVTIKDEKPLSTLICAITLDLTDCCWVKEAMVAKEEEAKISFKLLAKTAIKADPKDCQTLEAHPEAYGKPASCQSEHGVKPVQNLGAA